jgi:hypothetical protein
MGRLRGESCRGPKGSTLRTPQCLRVGRKEESVRHQGKLEEVGESQTTLLGKEECGGGQQSDTG